MKTVLLLIPSMAGVGGAERVVHSLSGLLQGPGCRVLQATFDSPPVQRHFESATPVHGLGPIPRLPLPLRPLAYAVAAWRLHQLKRRHKVDVTISNLWGADLISALSFGSDRKIALCHINVVGNVANRLMVRLRPLVAWVYQRFDRVIAVNESLADELRGLYRLPPERITHIDNFVDRPDAVSVLPADGVQRFVWCGRLSPEKNVAGLLHAWAAFAGQRSGVQLVLLGEGPLRDELLALAATLGLRLGATLADADAQVVFVGKVQRPADHMLGARALLLGSLAEGLPMVVLEALSLGLPVLASDCASGGVRAALVGQGRFEPDRKAAEAVPPGYLLPVPRAAVPGSLAVWNHALAQLSTSGPEHARWCAGALERASHFSAAAVRERWQAAIEFQKATA